VLHWFIKRITITITAICLTSKEDRHSADKLDKMTKGQWCERVDTSERQCDESHFPHTKTTRDKRLPPETNTD